MKSHENLSEEGKGCRVAASLLAEDGQLLSMGETDDSSSMGGTFWPMPQKELGNRLYGICILEMHGSQRKIRQVKFCEDARFSIHYHFLWDKP